MIRALFIAALFFTMMSLLISIQWLLGKLGLPGWGFISCNYYKVLRALLASRLPATPYSTSPIMSRGSISW